MEISKFDLEYSLNIQCLDLEFLSMDYLFVYCVNKTNTNPVEYSDLFHLINVNNSDAPVIRVNGQKIISETALKSAKVMAYKDVLNSSASYIVIAPRFDRFDAGTKSYIRIYEYKNRRISYSQNSTIYKEDLGL